MTNRRFNRASRVFTASMALACGACATMDSDGDRAETGPAKGYRYGVYVPNTQPQTPYASPYALPSSYLVPTPATQATMSMPLASSTVAAPSALPPDPGLYAGDQGFSPWPSANGPSWAVQSSVNFSNAQEVVAGMTEAFRRCYNTALKDDPEIVGHIRFQASIGPDGRVVSLSSTNVVGLPGNMVVCLYVRVQSAQFAPPEGGKATIVIPVSFATK